MDALLPYFEQELAFLRSNAGEFARRYPRIAGRLSLAGEISEDPHVERLIQSFALLASRVHRRLDDDFPLITESLLNVLYPHYLRPFPSCSIAQFELGQGAGQMSAAASIERGTELTTRQVRGVVCRFKTTQDVSLLPMKVRSAGYRNAVQAPEGTRLPKSATGVVSIQLELLSAQCSWAALNGNLRIYLDGEPSQVSVLREVLCNKVVAVMLQDSAHGPWSGSHTARPQLVGFSDRESLIPYDERSHPAYRLLTEFFAFPEKFNFVDIPLPLEKLSWFARNGREGAPENAPRVLTVHMLLSGIHSDSDEARLLEAVSDKSFALGCTPVVNLFSQNADPIRVTHKATQYPVVVDARRAFGYEVYSIDRVFRVKQTPQGESVDEFRPFFSLHHGDLLGKENQVGNAPPARYWHAHRDESVATASPGYELELSIVDIDFEPAAPQTDTLSLQVTATNRDIPSQLSAGSPGGDLFIEGGSVAREVRFLRKPTRPCRFEGGKGNLWRLVSHLSLNHLSLSGSGIDALREMLRLYDLPRDASNRSVVDGLVSIEFVPATAWLDGEPFASFVRGTEIRLTVDEARYVGTGLGVFAAVLDRFFGLYVHLNSFTQLTVTSARSGQPLIKCPPRNGVTALV